ncbi:MAG: cell division protein ZapE [Bdellovibrionales bacterium]
MPPIPTIQTLYASKLASGDLKPDPEQAQAVEALEVFADSLEKGVVMPAQAGIPFGFCLPWKKPPQAQNAPTGLYLFGSVGRGKSTLMDILMESLRDGQGGDKLRARRVHFHAFMLEIHARLHEMRQKQEESGAVVAKLARRLASEIDILGFDEFHVGNIADAMILGRLFESLFASGVRIVLTSNWPPDELYRHGLQRERFLPFIELIKQRMKLVCLGGLLDYRYGLWNREPAYYHPLGPEATRELEQIFTRLAHGETPEPMTLPLEGRSLTIPRAAKGVGWCDFAQLCGEARGAPDYLALAECFHTLMLENVPVFQAEKRDETMRFMTLIDALYEAKAKLAMTMAAPLDRLAPPGERAFAFQRTLSRLMEMQGDAYRHKPHLAE